MRAYRLAFFRRFSSLDSARGRLPRLRFNGGCGLAEVARVGAAGDPTGTVALAYVSPSSRSRRLSSDTDESITENGTPRLPLATAASRRSVASPSVRAGSKAEN